MLDELLDSSRHHLSNIDDVNDTLRHLPTNLTGMYNLLLVDHSNCSGTSQTAQVAILELVTQSTRPLRLLELSAMIDFLHPSLEQWRDTKAMVRDGCGPLLEVLEDGTVSIIHHSFTEFLVDESREATHAQFPVIDTRITQSTMAKLCLKYLTSGILNDCPIIQHHICMDLEERNQDSRIVCYKLRHPLLDYVAKNWLMEVLLDWIGMLSTES